MKNWVLAAAFVVSWSSGFVGATLGDRAATPASLLAWRYVVAALLLLMLTATRRDTRRELSALRRSEWVQQIVLGLLAHVVFLGGVFAAASAGLDAGVSALVCALQPMLVTAGGCLWFRDRLTGRQGLGLAAGIVGVAASVGGLGGSGLSALWMVTASLLALCAAALLERAWRPQVSVTSALTIQTSVGAVAFTAWAALTSGLHVAPTRNFGVAIVWLVVLSGFGGYATFTACLRRLGATPTSTLLYLTPAVTMLWAWLMFAQRPSVQQIAGLCVVLAGVALTMARPTGTRRHSSSCVRVTARSL